MASTVFFFLFFPNICREGISEVLNSAGLYFQAKARNISGMFSNGCPKHLSLIKIPTWKIQLCLSPGNLIVIA